MKSLPIGATCDYVACFHRAHLVGLKRDNEHAYNSSRPLSAMRPAAFAFAEKKDWNERFWCMIHRRQKHLVAVKQVFVDGRALLIEEETVGVDNSIKGNSNSSVNIVPRRCGKTEFRTP